MAACDCLIRSVKDLSSRSKTARRVVGHQGADNLVDMSDFIEGEGVDIDPAPGRNGPQSLPLQAE